MAKDPTRIVESWRTKRPPETSVEDVETVVAHFFPKSHRFATKSSHWLIIEDSDLQASEKGGYITGTTGGILTISHTNGKYVKWYLINNLIKAIDIKLKIAAIRDDADGKKERRKR